MWSHGSTHLFACVQADARWRAQQKLLQTLLARDAERGRQLSVAATALDALAAHHGATQAALELLQAQMQQVGRRTTAHDAYEISQSPLKNREPFPFGSVSVKYIKFLSLFMRSRCEPAMVWNRSAVHVEALTRGQLCYLLSLRFHSCRMHMRLHSNIHSHFGSRKAVFLVLALLCRCCSSSQQRCKCLRLGDKELPLPHLEWSLLMRSSQQLAQ